MSVMSPRSPPHRGPDRRCIRWSRDKREAAAGRHAHWQIVLPDGTTLGDIRYTLQRIVAICSTSDPKVSATETTTSWPGSGAVKDVDPGEYTFRTSTQIETAAPDLEWLNKGVFIGVAGRLAAKVIYEIYLVA